MAAVKKANQGYMNSNNKSSEKHPDYRAEIPVDSAFIKGLADAAGAGGAVLYIAGWTGVSNRDSQPYVFVRLASEKYQPKATVGAGNGESENPTPF